MAKRKFCTTFDGSVVFPSMHVSTEFTDEHALESSPTTSIHIIYHTTVKLRHKLRQKEIMI
jgi:hypothetical protein